MKKYQALKINNTVYYFIGFDRMKYQDRDETEKDTAANVYFDKLIMYFESYNCRDNENGKYAAYYIEA